MRKLILTIGHSNMCDRGDKTLLPVFDNAARMFVYRETDNWLAQTMGNPSPPAFIPNNPGYWTAAVDIVEPAGSNASNTAGPLQLALANELAGAFPDDEIGLVPHSLGGASMDGWAKWNRNASLYGMALQRLEWAREFPDSEVVGIVIWLGENDCSSTTLAATISQKMTNLITALRCDIGNLDLPVVIVKPGNESHSTLPGWSTMRQQIDWIAMRKVGKVDTDDISPLSGDVHFNTANYLIIGGRIADALITIM